MEGDGLPAGWTMTTLGDVLDRIVGGGTPSKNIGEYFEGTIPLMTVKDMKVARPSETGFNITEEALQDSSAKIVPADTVIIATRMGLGKVVRPKMDTAINQDLKALFPSEALEKSFLEWWLHSVARKIEAMGTGTTVKGVRLNEVKALILPLPPFPEQQRIVEKIETLFTELDKGEEALREVQKLLARYRQSILKAAVTGTLTADWRAANGPPKESGEDLLARILKTRRETWQGRGQYQEPMEPDTDGLPELPEGWVWASMDQLLGHLTSGSRDWKQYYGEGTGTFIMAQNVRPMRFDLTERFLVNPPPGSPDAVRSQVRLDDLLITIVGANTGDVCRIPVDVDEHYVCQSVALMRLVEPDLSRFIESFLSGKGAGRDQLEKHIYGAGRPHLSFEQLRSIAVPLPPNDEREELMGIVNETLSNLDHVQSACNGETKRSAGLRQSVLKAAFSGKLVPQDSSDEPADKLLERIRTARAEKPKAKRKKATA